MLHLEGDKDLPLPPPGVWVRLSDGRFLVHCVPDVAAVARAEPLEAEFTIRPGFAFVRGNLHTTLRIIDPAPAKSVQYEVQSKGIGSNARVHVNLDLSPTDAGTRIHWTCHITELGGLLKAIPKGLVQASAQKVIEDVWNGVEKRLLTDDRQ
jgi:carbon monoxide dehydrogenase subunit G